MVAMRLIPLFGASLIVAVVDKLMCLVGICQVVLGGSGSNENAAATICPVLGGTEKVGFAVWRH